MEAAHESQSKVWRRVPASVLAGLSAALALAAGLALRLWMLKQFFLVNGDSLIYGGLAKNLLLHGRYALNGAGSELYPTLIRLPGYPLFLVGCFRVFGMENYVSAAWVQIALELAGCLLLADFARRIAPAALSRGAAHGTLWLAALCPFTAVYAAEPMAEALTLFMVALALWSAARFRARPGWGPALWFTFAVTYAALLRPDGALVALALAPALLIGLWRKEGGAVIPAGKTFRMAVVCALLALMPFTAWSWRNWQVFHVFEPLAPRLATDPGEIPHTGWERWVKSWCLDFVSTYAETRFSWAYAGLNALYLLLGIAGLCLRPRFWRPMLAYLVLRSALLTTIEAPEARYTLECFPMLFALGGVALYRLTTWVLLVVLKVKASAGRG